MKSFIRSMCCMFLLGIFSVQAATKNDFADKESIEKNKKVNAKCHVTLVDGSEAVIFWRTQPKKISTLVNNIVGQKVGTHKSLEKIKIYRAFQCVLDGEDFSSFQARTIDEKTAR